MKRRAFLVQGLISASTAWIFSACEATKPNPHVDYIRVKKSERIMDLYASGEHYKRYKIALGFAPIGHKQFEGDGKTPEGRYYIYGKNPNSEFYRSLGISYPRPQDYHFAKQYNRSPGGEIFIHGEPNTAQQRARGNDWTAGCIAVSDKEIQEIYDSVKTRAIIDILP